MQDAGAQTRIDGKAIEKGLRVYKTIGYVAEQTSYHGVKMGAGNISFYNIKVPHSAIPPEGKIRAGYLRGFNDHVRQHSGNPRAILENHDIDFNAFLDPESHLESASVVKLLESSSTLFNDSLFGLHLADFQNAEVFGCVSVLARSAPTVREGLQSLIDYVPVVNSPEGTFNIVNSRTTMEFRWQTQLDLGECEQAHYHGMLLILRTLQMLGENYFRPYYAHLTFPVRQTDLHALENRLGCKVYSRAKTNCIAFPVDVLNYPLETSNKMIYELLGNYLAQVRSSRSTLLKLVKDYVEAEIHTGHCTVEDCALKLGISTRTLQKRLANLGFKFWDILQDHRIDMAKHQLRHGNKSIDEIAFQLGYSEQTSFGRAFKRSTGVTPLTYRRTII